MSDIWRSVAAPAAPPARDEANRVPPDWFGNGAATQQLAAALDAISEGFVVLDRDWRFVYVNSAAERLLQKSRAELLGRDYWELYPEASRLRFGAESRRAVAENVPVDFEEFYPEPLNAWFEVREYPSPEGLSVFFRDITTRRTVAEALRQSEERYRTLFNSLTEGFAIHEVVCDDDGVPRDSRFLDINPAFEVLTGLTRDAVVGRLASEVFRDDDRHWVHTCGAVAVTGETAQFDHFSRTLGRHFRMVAFRPAPRRFAVLFHDITERRQLEETLRTNLTKYSVLFDSLPVGISVTDSAGRVLEVNQASLGILGTTREAVLGQQVGSPVWRIIRPDGSLMPPAEFASVRALRERVVVHDVETGIARPGEDVIWVSVTAAALPLEGYGLMICYQDISRRRRAEAELIEAYRQAGDARARLEAAMEAVPIGLVIQDAAGGIIRANPAYERIWGAGRPPTRSFEDNREYRARWLDTGREVLPDEWASARAHLQGETVVGQLMEIDRFDGGRTVILNSAAPIFDPDGASTGCAVAVQDVGRLIEAERALERSETALRAANDQLEAANAELLRNNEVLEARVAERTAELTLRAAQLQALALERTRVQERERQRIARMIHDHLQQLLSVARIKLGMALGQVAAAASQESLRELDGLIAESLAITRTIIADLSPTILYRSNLTAALRWLGGWFETRFGLKVDVVADEDMDVEEDIRVTLFRSVRELLFNVVKHAHVTSARVDVSRTVDGRVRIVVHDKGVGFDPEILRTWDGGHGNFGLFSLREHLEPLGGQLDVESAPGCGASFTILGPVPPL